VLKERRKLHPNREDAKTWGPIASFTAMRPEAIWHQSRQETVDAENAFSIAVPSDPAQVRAAKA
jgi:hypothetical protein